jgi:hypothetical protein
VVDLAILALGRGPAFPTVVFIEDEGVLLPVQPGLHRFLLFHLIEVFEEEEPRGLLGVIQFSRATGLFPENVVYISEGLFKHGLSSTPYPLFGGTLRRRIPCFTWEITTPWKAHGTDLLIVYNQNGLGDESGA